MESSSVKEFAKLIGTVVLISDGEVKYEATIEDVKVAYGRALYLVKPVAGSGEKWVADYSNKKTGR